MADHPVAALLGEVLSMRHLPLLKSTGKQGTAVLIGHMCEVLAGHADPRTLALPQPLNELLVLVPHRTNPSVLLYYPRTVEKCKGRNRKNQEHLSKP